MVNTVRRGSLMISKANQREIHCIIQHNPFNIELQWLSQDSFKVQEAEEVEKGVIFGA